MTIDPASPVPKYSQLRELLMDWIADAGLTVDDIIPSERELGTTYGLSRMTVRQTVDQLVSEGKLYRVPGKGTFVARPKIEMSLALASFTEDMRARGYQPGARDIARRVVPASGHTAKHLGIPPGAEVHQIERLRTADGEPMAVERTNVPASLVPGLDARGLSECSLYEVLEQEYGIVFDSGEQTIEATLCDPVDARLLGLPPGSPVLAMRRISLSNGTRVEFAVSTYRADRYQLHSHLDRYPGR
ncbi:GntR family transcriptional regulator [Lipingzhangella halophila]|uniref:GntR family transcriptional regulator n=1 Tax=Lipingzhangella halophila TaxID=1783352 RepID=A0A7W7W4R5_9ACTN|nr:GntR family transcriptional regulator [Lipingzhangella halophila]MBB4933868.1 GntR family transcriptional regulator [Lipingzhangella halophila]